MTLRDKNGLRVWSQEEKSYLEYLIHGSKLTKTIPLKTGLIEAGLSVVEHGEKIIATSECGKMEITLTTHNFVVKIKGEEKTYDYTLENVLGFWEILRSTWKSS